MNDEFFDVTDTPGIFNVYSCLLMCLYIKVLCTIICGSRHCVQMVKLVGLGWTLENVGPEIDIQAQEITHQYNIDIVT